MIELTEKCSVSYGNETERTLNGVFEVTEPVSLVEIKCPSGTWKGYVPMSADIFTLKDGKLISPSGREIPQLKKQRNYFFWILILILVLAFLLYWKWN